MHMGVCIGAYTQCDIMCNLKDVQNCQDVGFFQLFYVEWQPSQHLHILLLNSLMPLNVIFNN